MQRILFTLFLFRHRRELSSLCLVLLGAGPQSTYYAHVEGQDGVIDFMCGGAAGLKATNETASRSPAIILVLVLQNLQQNRQRKRAQHVKETRLKFYSLRGHIAHMNLHLKAV